MHDNGEGNGSQSQWVLHFDLLAITFVRELTFKWISSAVLWVDCTRIVTCTEGIRDYVDTYII